MKEKQVQINISTFEILCKLFLTTEKITDEERNKIIFELEQKKLRLEERKNFTNYKKSFGTEREENRNIYLDSVCKSKFDKSQKEINKNDLYQ